MKLTKKEEKVKKEAIAWVKANKQAFIKKFILDKKVLPLPIVAFFMAGSPGVGKTEYVDEYEKEINEKFRQIKKEAKLNKIINLDEYDNFFVRIDIDEIRRLIPQYQITDKRKNIKGNAHIVQSAANIALDTLRKYCIKKELSFLLDGTFGNQFSTFDKMIRKLIKQKRHIGIFFIYTNPLVAWNFTKKREFMEGRNITKENFIKQYFKSIDNVRRIKQKFGKTIKLNLVLKDDKNKKEKVYFNRSFKEVEKLLKMRYDIDRFTKEYLEENIK